MARALVREPLRYLDGVVREVIVVPFGPILSDPLTALPWLVNWIVVGSSPAWGADTKPYPNAS